MRMALELEKDKHWSGVVSTAASVVTGHPKTWALSVLNRTANRTSDNTWKIGDQAMNETAFVSVTGGRFL